jgi:tetratricopeptide (TPR) repeat protein
LALAVFRNRKGLMNLEQKLQFLRASAAGNRRDSDLEHQLKYLLKLEKRQPTLPAERAARAIEECVEGKVAQNACGEFFLAEQNLPFGRPYGRARVGDVALADLSPLNLFLPGQTLPPSSSILYLDTETTGLAGGTGTCAFMIGIGRAEGSGFRVRQFFLRELTEEKAALAALTEALASCEAVVTFNGKTFDLPLLETRYRLARMRSPFGGFMHLDLLHPARRMWKLRLESCELKRLEREVLAVERHGDVDGADIPRLYFDYLRRGDARGLEAVFFHNALDIVTLAALAAALAETVRQGAENGLADGRDLFSLSRIFHRAGESEQAVAACRKALERGLPASVEPRALGHLALECKRRRDYAAAVELWREMARRDTPDSIQACEQLAIHYEHRERDFARAAEFAEAALEWLRHRSNSDPSLRRLSHRLDRLRRKIGRADLRP